MIGDRVTVHCKNPRCEASWGVPIHRESTANCVECGAKHEMDEDGFYWMMEGEAQS